MKLEALDLNLLLAFEAMMAEQNVTRAAARIGLTQPAMSSALSRLRRLIGDPLFERANGRMQPTRRARALYGPIGESLARIRTALEAQPFRAEESSREFRIVATYYVELLVLPHVIAEVARIAPKVLIRVVSATALFEVPLSLLQSGAADLAIGFYGTLTPANLVWRKLYDERFVAVVKQSAKLPRGKLTYLQTQYPDLAHVRMIYGPLVDAPGMTDSALHARGLERRVGTVTAHVSSVPRVVAATGFIGVVPERLAHAEASRLRLKICEVPVTLPDVPCMLVWHERAQEDPALVWLRDVIARAAS